MIKSVDLRILANAIVEAIPEPDRILTAKQVAKILDIKPEVINRMCKDGKIPASKLENGSKWYISERALKEKIFKK